MPPSTDTTNQAAALFPSQVVRASLFVVAAVLTFPLVAAFVAVAAPKLALLQHRSPLPLAATHLVTLGWGTMVAIGALHQLLPAAAGVRRDPSPAAPIQFAVHAAGVALLAGGLLTGSHPAVIGGGCATSVSVLLSLGLAAPILRRRRRSLSVLGYVAASLICLGAAALWGLLLAANRAFVFSTSLLMPAGLVVHLALGLIGWFALLVIGVSYYLLPRLAGIGGPAADHAGPVFAGLAAAVVLVTAGAFYSPAAVRTGLMFAGIAGMVYAWDIISFLGRWRPRGRDIAKAHWQVIAAETIVLSAGAWAWALGWLPGSGMRWGAAGVTVFLLGWVTLAIAGQFYKVTPFLMWYYRFHMGLSAYDVPRLEEPYWPRVAAPPFVLLACAAPLIALGILLASPVVGLAGGLAFLAGAASFSFALGYSWLPAFLRSRRPPLSAEPR